MASKTKWPEHLIALAEWAFRKEDLRHQFLHAKNATYLQSSPGIAKSIETTIVLAVYEAGLAKGFVKGKTIDYERPYPSKRKKGNRKKSDLAFKDSGIGKNWGYIEVKRYSGDGAAKVRGDITKLNKIVKKVQRWMLVYRIRSGKEDNQKKQHLNKLLSKKSFKKLIEIRHYRHFNTISRSGKEGICEICLAKLR